MAFRATEIALLGSLTLPDWAVPYMTNEVISQSLLIMILFMASFFLGFAIPFGRISGGASQHSSFNNEAGVPKLFILLMTLGGIFALMEIFSQLPELVGVVFLSQGDPGEFFTGKGLWISCLSLLPAAGLGVLLSCRTAYSFTAVAFLLVAITVVVYAPLGQRGNIFTFVLLALSLLTARYPRIKRSYLVGIGMLIFLGMGTMVLWRTAIRSNSSFEDILSDMYWFQGMDRGDFEAFAGVVAYNVSVGYDSWWSFAIQLVPRFLYPSKEGYIAVSYLMDQQIHGEYDAGLTTSIVGTLFAQGGYVMVAVAAFGLGIVVKSFQNICARKELTSNRALLNGVLTAFILFLTRNGDLTNVVIMLVANLMGVFLVMGGIVASQIWRRSTREYLSFTGNSIARFPEPT